MQKPSDRKLAALCNYLALPDAQNAQTILDEAICHIQSMEITQNMALLAAQAGKAELLDRMEAAHGLRPYLFINLYSASDIELLESCNLSDELRKRVYTHAVNERMGQARFMDFNRAAKTAGSAHSKLLMRILIEENRPSSTQLIEMLFNQNISESAAFNRQAKFIAQTYADAVFSGEEINEMIHRSIEKYNLRGLAVAVKLGQSVSLPMLDANDVPRPQDRKIFSKIVGGLSSYHGHLHLVKSLPSLEALLRPSEVTLRKNLQAALAP